MRSRSLYSSWAVGFIRVCPGCCWVHPGWHSGAPWGSLGLSAVVWYTRVRPKGRWVNPVSLGSIGCNLGIVGFTRVHPGGRWVLPGSLDLLGCALMVVGFIWGRWVHTGVPLGSIGTTGIVVFTRVIRGSSWIHPG